MINIMQWLINNLGDPLILVFFLSSLVTTLLAYLQAPITSLQQIASALIVVVLILYSHFISAKARLEQTNTTLANSLTLTILLASSIFVQLLILSTGGLYSPFIILIYFFALGLSFQVNAKASISFLIFSTLFLAVNIAINPLQQQFIKQDPAASLLYLVAFIGTMHLSQFLSTSYHIKSELYKILAWQMRIDESIINYLKELIIITNVKLQIVYANQAAITALDIQEDKIFGASLLDILNLNDSNKIKVTTQSLLIDKILQEKAMKVIKNFYLYTNNQKEPLKIVMQILPILNQEGKINQLAFIIAQDY